jgi:hypothetical protein
MLAAQTLASLILLIETIYYKEDYKNHSLVAILAKQANIKIIKL